MGHGKTIPRRQARALFIGDVRDKDRLYRALDGVDYVVHAAATKIVPTAEYNPFECVKTNINGAMNLIDACIDKGVKKSRRPIHRQSQQPHQPIRRNQARQRQALRGGQRLFGRTRHALCRGALRQRDGLARLGHPRFFLTQRARGTLPITDPRMTRFMISLEQGVELVWHAFDDMVGGEIYVKKSRP